MASSLIESKRITTTVAKAKALRKYVEPLITKAKDDSTHSRRVVFSYLQNKDSVKALFGEVVEKVGTRPGGYTRIIKLGKRLGDNAEMCVMELVDYNALLVKEDKPAAKKTTRRRKKAAPKADASVEAAESSAEEVAPEAKADDASEEETKDDK
jgi:large subunit ribosomal protein L17